MNGSVCSGSALRWPAEAQRRALQKRIVAIVWILLSARTAWGGPFADAVAAFRPGSGAGYGMERVPGVVLGPPQGGGLLQGSLDVLSLGQGGEIVLQFDPPLACNGPGPDLLVFENPFHVGGPDGPVFAELAFVAVSQDGVNFVEFPWDRQTWQGLAGKTPVWSNPENGIDPRDPARAGGDSFDLEDVGLPWIRFVRITDTGDRVPDPGNRLPGAGTAGFDLDAIAALYPCVPDKGGTPSLTATPTRMAAGTATPSPSPTTTPMATSVPTVSPTPPCAELEMLLGALFARWGAADWNNDGRVSVADLLVLLREATCAGSGGF
ncbi:MAG: hypothetical protein KatS3mg077_1865 [Candidatus Binatia bacterium]|nr:MAG: hypothetical protein KatS3mg077_1865 [Candidatus Binatia bacterium]